MGAQLKLFRPTPHAGDALTLVGFFLEYVWPALQVAGEGRQPRTRDDYLHTLGHWERITGNPPLSAMEGAEGKRILIGFLHALKEEGLAQNTRHKHWSNVQRLFDWTGPPSRQNRRGFGLVVNPPYVDGPGRLKRPPRAGFRLDELWRWLAVLAAHARPMPDLVFDPATWWRAVILVGYNTGLRPETLFGARWEHLAVAAEVDCPRCGERRRRGMHRFSPPRAVVKGRQTRIFWLNHAALEAIAPLRPPGPQPRGLIFGWDWTRRYTTLGKRRRELQRIAGIRQLPLYALRRAFSTECGKINPLAMRMQMGHSAGEWRMAAEHYVWQEDLVADALERLPQPQEARQQRLF
jgi:integrase